MKNLFEIADRKKYRFPTRKGNASCEDLWDLSLESLDIIISTLDAELNARSFINKPIKDKEDLQNKFDIIQHIITVKIIENTPKDIPEKEIVSHKFL